MKHKSLYNKETKNMVLHQSRLINNNKTELTY